MWRKDEKYEKKADLAAAGGVYGDRVGAGVAD